MMCKIEFENIFIGTYVYGHWYTGLVNKPMRFTEYINTSIL